MDALWWILIAPVLVLILWMVEYAIFRVTGTALPPFSFFLRKVLFADEGIWDPKQLGPQGKIDPAVLQKTTTLTFPDGKIFSRTRPDPAELAETVCKIFLQSSTTPATSKIPEDLQGVFWMDGNGFPEELVCTNYATWDPAKNFLTVPWTYNMWSWPDDGKPVEGSIVSKMLASFNSGQAVADVANPTTGPQAMLVFAFDGNYPMSHTQYANRPAAQLASKSSFNFATESAGSRIQHWSLKPLPGKSPESVDFRRRIVMFGVAEMYSYNLRKIMHTDGTKIQPAYDDFVKYMGTTQKGKGLMTWKGINGGEGPQYPAGSEPGPGPVKAEDLEATL